MLVNGGFASIPPMIREGRKVLRNLQRVAKLFVAKSALAAFLILTVGLSAESLPLPAAPPDAGLGHHDRDPGVLPRPRAERRAVAAQRFLRELASFAIPAGTATGLGVVASFLFSINLLGMDEVRARTVATTVLVAMGLYLIVVLESSSLMRSYTVGGLCLGLFALYLVVLSLPAWRGFFEVAAPDLGIIMCSLAGTALAVGGLVLSDERFLPAWPRGRRPAEPPGSTPA